MNIGVFTTIKVRQGVPLFFEEHQNRLLTHTKALKIKQPTNLEKKVKNFIKKNSLTDCALRITCIDKKVLLESRPIPPVNPISLITFTDTRNQNKIYKTTERAINEQAKEFAAKNHANDALFINNNYLIESTIANIFSLNEKGEIITPPLDGKGLAGIARKIIMKNLPVREEKIPQNSTQPIVLINSLRVQMITHLNGKKLQNADKLFQTIKTTLEKTENEYLSGENKLFYKLLPTWQNPEKVFTILFAGEQNSFWLDSSLTNKENRFSYMGTPTEIYSYRLKNEKTKDIFTFMDQQLVKNRMTAKLPFPFIGGFVGYFGYEIKALTGGKSTQQSPYPDSLWYKVERFIAFDHKEKKVYLVCRGKNKTEADEWFETVKNKLTQNHYSKLVSQYHKEKPVFRLARDQKQYLTDINTCKNYLAKGESYQICLTNTIQTESDIDPFILYKMLRKKNPAPYSAYIKYKNLAVICSSPELFLQINPDKTVTTKPIKGTMRRGQTAIEDAELKQQLMESKKDWSENAMIVDLLRNDLGKVCEFGSVKVTKSMTIESYQTVHQLVSTITGKLRADVSLLDCIKACFPGGSMTGAPKKRTMEIIDSLEKQARGIYSGALGFLSFNQTAVLNIVIRTIIAEKNKLSMGVGGAILTDSDPQKEYEEMLLKAKALLESIQEAVYTKPMHTVFLALGTNVGNKKNNIKQAIATLEKHLGKIESAKLYETKPMYFEDQDMFLNTVIKGKTSLTPQELLAFVKLSEEELGRQQRFPNGPREIDIDILFYDKLIYESADLIIPHPRIRERDFVLKPFTDIEPNFLHPVLQKTMKELYTDLAKQNKKEKK